MGFLRFVILYFIIMLNFSILVSYLIQWDPLIIIIILFKKLDQTRT